MEKRKLLIGLILFLVITNLVTIASVMWHTNKTTDNDTATKAEVTAQTPGAIPEGQRAQYFAMELKLDSDQQAKFGSIQREYMREARSISAEMSHLRDDLLEAMDQDNPDSNRLNDLSGQIGSMHTKLKMLTVKYYIGLKAICKPDQQDQLYDIIRKIIKPDGEVALPQGGGAGEGGRKGGRGKGRGPWWDKKKDSVSNQ